MFLYDFISGIKKPLPLVPEIWLLNNRFFGKLAQFFLLNNIVCKMMGFILCSRWSSVLLNITRISRLINQQADLIFRKFKYRTLNEAFIHRYENNIYPDDKNNDFIVAPASAYLSIRDINDGLAEFFPGVTIDIKTMLADTTGDYDQGKLMVFTLKPFHDHTIDFPVNCKIQGPLREFAKNRFRVDSTDLHLAKASKGKPTLQNNHRVVAILQAESFDEKLAMAEIGANVVNSIEQDYDNTKTKFTKGQQKSHFNYGSTVVLVLSNNLAKKTRFIDEIYQNASKPTGTCQVKRGTALLYDNNTESGTYQIADDISLQLTRQGNKIIETINRN
ncbi:MAG: phosphatidylserine decarboxylase [Phycisphaerae bacterium]|nr:phosphatidylserine decarboxylase [Phycisphaerae bacterium]